MPICKSGYLVKGYKQYPWQIERDLFNGDRYHIMQSFDEYDRELQYNKKDGQWVRQTKRTDLKSETTKVFNSVEEVAQDISNNMQGENVEILKNISLSLHVL